jgi:hypothetical protein
MTGPQTSVAADRFAAVLEGYGAEELDRLRSVKWATEFLGLGVSTLYRYAEEGSITHVKLPGKERKSGKGKAGRVMFRLRDLLEWTQEREVAQLVAELPRSSRQVAADLQAVRAIPGGGA